MGVVNKNSVSYSLGVARCCGIKNIYFYMYFTRLKNFKKILVSSLLDKIVVKLNWHGIIKQAAN